MDYKRLVELAEILVKYEGFGVVETLIRHECNGQIRAPEYYLPCCVNLQTIYCQKHRYCYLLSGE